MRRPATQGADSKMNSKGREDSKKKIEWSKEKRRLREEKKGICPTPGVFEKRPIE